MIGKTSSRTLTWSMTAGGFPESAMPSCPYEAVKVLRGPLERAGGSHPRAEPVTLTFTPFLPIFFLPTIRINCVLLSSQEIYGYDVRFSIWYDDSDGW